MQPLIVVLVSRLTTRSTLPLLPAPGAENVIVLVPELSAPEMLGVVSPLLRFFW